MPDFGLSEIHYDCMHFRGGIPCKPNKLEGAVCPGCNHYTPISKRILIIKLGALGDVIRTTPLVVRFRELYPNCHITWLTFSPEVLPSVDINEILRPDAFSLLKIQEGSFDIAVNLDKEEEACVLLARVSAPEKYGYTWENGHLAPATPAATHKLMTGFFDQISKANTKSYLEEIFEICHMEFRFEPYLINKNTLLADSWRKQLQEHAQGKLIVGLNTGCGPRWNTRLWPESSWKQLAADLVKEGMFPVFLGGSLENEKNSRMSAETGAFYPGHFSLEEFIALTDGCDVVVTQVSMMMHIATALQKNMVLMNNIFNRHEFELYGRGEIVEPSTGCVCFYGNTCTRGGESCMHDLSAPEVLAAISRISAVAQ